METKRSGIAAIAIVASLLLVPPLAYVGSYLALLDGEPEAVGVVGCKDCWIRSPYFRFGGEASKAFFSPIALLDQAVRPGYWRSDSLRRIEREVDEQKRFEQERRERCRTLGLRYH